MSTRKLIIQMKAALELHNKELKALADSGDAGFWKAEDTLEYQQAEAAIAAADAYLQPKPTKETTHVHPTMLRPNQG